MSASFVVKTPPQPVTSISPARRGTQRTPSLRRVAHHARRRNQVPSNGSCRHCRPRAAARDWRSFGPGQLDSTRRTTAIQGGKVVAYAHSRSGARCSRGDTHCATTAPYDPRRLALILLSAAPKVAASVRRARCDAARPPGARGARVSPTSIASTSSPLAVASQRSRTVEALPIGGELFSQRGGWQC